MLAWASVGGKAGIHSLEIEFLLRNTLISLHKLHFRIILPLPEVLPLPGNWSRDAHVCWLHHQRQSPLKQHQPTRNQRTRKYEGGGLIQQLRR